jgi:hypothetical protein
MNHLRDVDFWLKAGPTLVALIGPILSYLWLAKRLAKYQTRLSKEMEAYKIGLSMELENYKGGIIKELEIHKLQIQSSFQTRFYEFQTRYSWLHKERAEAIMKMYGLVAKVHYDLKIWSDPGERFLTKPVNEFYKDSQDHLVEMTQFFDQKRIFFDDKEIAEPILKLILRMSWIYGQHHDIESAKTLNPQLADSIKQEAAHTIDQLINPLVAQLRGIFRKLLEAETPSHQGKER